MFNLYRTVVSQELRLYFRREIAKDGPENDKQIKEFVEKFKDPKFKKVTANQQEMDGQYADVGEKSPAPKAELTPEQRAEQMASSIREDFANKQVAQNGPDRPNPIADLAPPAPGKVPPPSRGGGVDIA